MIKYYVHTAMIGRNYVTKRIEVGTILVDVQIIYSLEQDRHGRFKEDLAQFKVSHELSLQVPYSVFDLSTFLLTLDNIQKRLSGEIESNIPRDVLLNLLVDLI